MSYPEKRDDIIADIENEYQELMRPHKEELVVLEKRLEDMSSMEDDIRKEYDGWISRRLESYRDTKREHEHDMRNAVVILERISGIDVSDDFSDMYSYIKHKLSMLARRNDFIFEKIRDLDEGKLDYDETYECFREKR